MAIAERKLGDSSPDPLMEENPGGRPVGIFGIYLIMAYTLLVTILVLYALVKIWPPFREDLKGSSNAGATANPAPSTSPSASPAPSPTAKPSTTPAAVASASPAASANASPVISPAVSPAASPNPSPVGSPATSPGAGQSAALDAAQCNPPPNTLDNPAACKCEKPNQRRAPVSFLWWDGCLWDEDRLLLIVTLAGALGALAHGLRSLSWYIGNRRLYASWTAMYFMLPFLGAAISVIFYLIVRGGFFSPTAEVVDTSPFGFAALGALIGMFTEEAVRKLKNVAGTVLTTAEQGKEHVGAAPTITSIAPPTGSTAGQDVVKIAGSNFLAGVQVSFDGLNAAVNEATTTLLTVVTPPHAAGTVVLEVTNADGQKAAASFIYVAPPPPPPPPPGT